MSWRITPTYTPPFPESPSDEDEWTDVNTGLTWVYSSASDEWTQH
jgi:hypothetical protein